MHPILLFFYILCYLFLQEFLHDKLPELINNHVFLDGSLVLGQALIELGRVETYLTRASRNQLQGELVNLPPDEGSFMSRVVCNPDNVDLEHITPEVIQVGKYSTLRTEVFCFTCLENGIWCFCAKKKKKYFYYFSAKTLPGFIMLF